MGLASSHECQSPVAEESCYPPAGANATMGVDAWADFSCAQKHPLDGETQRTTRTQTMRLLPRVVPHH